MSISRERKFTERRVGGDYAELGKKYGVDPLIVRLLYNRGVGENQIPRYLNGGLENLHSPHLLRDADKAADILLEQMASGKHIRVIGDYDIDGVMSSYILTSGLRRAGANVSVQIPHRINDGYGLNRNLIEEAHAEQVDCIITCDNGISAPEEISLARTYGIKVIVTDHHRITSGIPDADAVVNPHREDCSYPFPDICGATVAWKVLCIVLEKTGNMSWIYDYLENLAFATIGDIMPLRDENRILVKEGLKAIQNTRNKGMAALIAQCQISDKVRSYHFGFVLGPCINATGRLDTAARALELFLTESETTAIRLASELVAMNEERKLMTEEGTQAAMQMYESGDYKKDPVIVLFLPDVHESIAGIIAGRVREAYYKPTFILTRGESSAKGSARSIDGYSLADELVKCRDLLLKFGGHPKAAGLSIEEDRIELFRKRINELCPISVEDEIELVRLDACPPLSYLSIGLAEQLLVLEPTGNENRGALFGAKNLSVDRILLLGASKNVVKLQLRDSDGICAEGICFSGAQAFIEFLEEKHGEEQVHLARAGKANQISLGIVYTPSINEFRGSRTLQLDIKYYF